MPDIKEDIKKYLFDKNINQNDFAKELGYSYEYISRILNGKDKVNDRFLHKLGTKYQDFDKHFDINIKQYDEPPLKEKQVSDLKKYTPSVEVVKKDFIKAKVVNAYAYASYTENWDDPGYYLEMEELETVQKEDGNYLWFEVRGDSMSREKHPSYDEGTYILGRELYRKHWLGLQLRRAKVWVINHRERGLMIKEIIKQDNNIITCHSWNPLVKDFFIDLNDVVQLFYYKEARYR